MPVQPSEMGFCEVPPWIDFQIHSNTTYRSVRLRNLNPMSICPLQYLNGVVFGFLRGACLDGFRVSHEIEHTIHAVEAHRRTVDTKIALPIDAFGVIAQFAVDIRATLRIWKSTAFGASLSPNHDHAAVAKFDFLFPFNSINAFAAGRQSGCADDEKCEKQARAFGEIEPPDYPKSQKVEHLAIEAPCGRDVFVLKSHGDAPVVQSR
jgi:hypothetical protein